MGRPASLVRLLGSLLRVDYADAVVDVLIHVDRDQDQRPHYRTVELAQRFSWPHGTKRIVVESEQIGLRRSWLSVSPRSVHTHVVIFEDDMEVSPQFYKFFKLVHESNLFTRSTAICLHPSDWELKVIAERQCELDEVPGVRFYFTLSRTRHALANQVCGNINLSLLFSRPTHI